MDIRRSSPTFGKWVGEILSAGNKRMLWIPQGFAHGFLVLSESAEFLYKTTDYWAPEHERSLVWCDPDLAIAWPIGGHRRWRRKTPPASDSRRRKFFPDGERLRSRTRSGYRVHEPRETANMKSENERKHCG